MLHTVFVCICIVSSEEAVVALVKIEVSCANAFTKK